MFKKQCPSNKYLNEKTNICVKKTGKLYADLMKKKYQNKPRKCVNNPITNRCVVKDGILYNKLVNENHELHVTANCVHNRTTNRCLKKYMKAHEVLKGKSKLNEEIILKSPSPEAHHMAYDSTEKAISAKKKEEEKKNKELSAKKKEEEKKNKELSAKEKEEEKKNKELSAKEKEKTLSAEKNKPKLSSEKRTETCKNDETFTMFENVKDIPKKQFIQLSSGYCFDVDDLMEYIKSDNFRNKNPHDTNVDLIDVDRDSIHIKHFPQLKKQLNEYFANQKAKEKNVEKSVYDNLDLLYEVGNIGRILAFDQIYRENLAFQVEDSSVFERSILAITKFSELLKTKPKDVIDLFENKLVVPYATYSIKKILDDADKGNNCIHGLGLKLCNIFIYWFVILEKKYDIKYDVTKTKFLLKWTKSKLIVYDMSINKSPSDYNEYWYFVNLIKHTKNTSLIDYKRNLKRIYEHYDKTCGADANMVTLDNVDKWEDVQPWRIIKLKNYCYDILFLIKTIVSSLNASDYSNPKPVFPKNPFTMELLTINELKLIDHRIQVHKLFDDVHNPLKVFLSETKLWKNSTTWFITALEAFNKELRFKRNGAVDSQNNYTGFWVSKKNKITKNEQNIKDLLAFHPQAPQYNKLKKLIKENSKEDNTLIDKYYFNTTYVK